VETSSGDELPDSSRIVVYGTSYCGFCTAAESLLKTRGLPFDQIDVTRDPARRKWLIQATGRRTVPQIFIDGRPIGGYTDLARLARAGELDRMLD
jgi:GrxC family glutaredoxin